MNTYSNMVKLAGQRGRYESVLTRAKQKVGFSEGPAGEKPVIAPFVKKQIDKPPVSGKGAVIKDGFDPIGFDHPPTENGEIKQKSLAEVIIPSEIRSHGSATKADKLHEPIPSEDPEVSRISAKLELEQKKADLERKMKELDEIEADLKEFEIVVQNIPVYQRPMKEIGGFASSQEAREEYNRVMAEYAALLKENGQTDSNFGRNVRYVTERGAAGAFAAMEGLADAGAVALADERIGKALKNLSPALHWSQNMNNLFAQKGVIPEEYSFDEIAKKMLIDAPSQAKMQDIESRYAPGRIGQTAGEVSQAVGGMIPAIAANLALPGSGLIVTGLQAGGQGAQQAYQEGAAPEQATNFGVLSGVVEAGIEALSGGVAGLGKGFLDTIAGKSIGKMISRFGAAKTGKILSALADNAFVKGLADSMGEGLEEGVSAVLIPYLERLTYNREAETATADEVLHDIFIGALTGGVFQGGNVLLSNKTPASGEAGSKYTKEEADAIRYEGKTFRNLIAGIDSTVSEFFNRWAGGRKSHAGEKLEKLYLGKMPDGIKAEVSEILGYEVAERDFIITNDDVKHIMDEHGDAKAELRKGNLPLTQWILDAIPEVVTNPDTVEAGHAGTGKNAWKTGVLMSKTFPNGRVVSVHYDNKGRGTLEVTTLYAKESTTSMVTAPDETDTGTPKVMEPVLSSNAIIPQSYSAVNESRLEQDPFLRGFNEGESEETGLGTAVEGWGDDPFLQGFYEEDEELHSKKTREVSGIVRDTTFRKANLYSKTVRELDAVAKVAGVEVRFVPEVVVNGRKGNAKYENGVITIALDAKDPIRTAFTHEIIHRIKEVSPEVYKTLSDFVQGHMRKGSLEALGEFYSEAYETDDVSTWTEEMVADAFGTMLSDSTMMGQFVQDNRTAAQKVLDAIQDFVAAIKRMLNGQNVRLSREERNAFSELQTDLEGMEKTLADALNAIEGSKNAATVGDGTKLSIYSKFYDTFDRWDKETTGFSFVVGETSDVLQAAGIPKKQIRMDASKIVTLLNKHSGMSTDIVRQIPELLEMPVVVIDSKKGSHAKVVMGDLVDENGKTVTVILLLTPTSKKGNTLDIIKVSSAEGRGHINSLFVKDDGTPVAVRYVDKKRILSWLNANRLQLPLHNLGLDPKTTVAQTKQKSNPQLSRKNAP